MNIFPLPFTPKEEYLIEIGRKFAAARKMKGLTIEQLTEKANVSPFDVQMWETGPECLRPLQAILGVLGRDLNITKGEIVLSPQGL